MMGSSRTIVFCVLLSFLNVVCGQNEILAKEENSNEEGSSRHFLTDKNSEFYAGLGGMVTMTLVGLATSLYGNKKIRNDIFAPSISNRRSDGFGRSSNYADRIDQFERNLANGVRSRVHHARNYLKSGARRSGNAVRYSASAAGRGMRNLVFGVNRLGRVARKGMRSVGVLTSLGFRKMGQGVSNAGKASTYGIARASQAAVSGLYGFGKSYAREMGKIRSMTSNGLSRMGTTYTRGWRNLGRTAKNGIHNIRRSYRKGVNRVGNIAYGATNTLGNVAQESVNRIGALASDSAQSLGGLATNIVEVASIVPQGMAAVAREKKVQDCLMQTLCYATTPILNKEHRRKRRSLMRSLKKSFGRSLEDDEESLNYEGRQNQFQGEGEDDHLTEEDCERLECSIATLGRQAYGLVQRFRESLSDPSSQQQIEQNIV